MDTGLAGDGEHDALEPVAGEVASLGQDWAVVTGMLPAHWQAKAKELGAIRRLRGFASVEAFCCGCC